MQTPGEEFTIEQALMAVMLQSANEMTLAVGGTYHWIHQEIRRTDEP